MCMRRQSIGAFRTMHLVSRSNGLYSTSCTHQRLGHQLLYRLVWVEQTRHERFFRHDWHSSNADFSDHTIHWSSIHFGGSIRHIWIHYLHHISMATQTNVDFSIALLCEWPKFIKTTLYKSRQWWCRIIVVEFPTQLLSSRTKPCMLLACTSMKVSIFLDFCETAQPKGHVSKHQSFTMF